MKRAEGVLLALIAAGVMVVGCNAIFGLDEGEPFPAECARHADCDDGNPCTVDQCLPQQGCFHAPIEGLDAPADEQVAGDCKRIRCSAEGSEEVSDDTDIPNDGTLCTVDSCNEGEPVNAPVAIGTPCDVEQLGGTCNEAGACVQCNGAADCDMLPDNSACHTRACIDGSCVSDNTPQGTALPAAAQVAGDCKNLQCDGNGGSEEIVDDGDVPDDGKQCTADTCSGGVPSNNNESNGTPCGVNNALTCDSAGQCTGCTSAGQCGVNTFCQSFSCQSTNCVTTNTDNGEVLPSNQQTPQDCQEMRCNGNGLALPVPANDPIPDGSDCTTDSCVNGGPIYNPLPINLACSMPSGRFCDGSGTCVDCNEATQCSGADGICEFDQCVAKACNIANVPNGLPAQSGQTSGDCNTLECDGNGNGSQVATPSDVPSDPNQCTTGTCAGNMQTSVPKPGGTACSEMNGIVCNGQGSCEQCFSNLDCPNMETCDLQNWICSGSGGTGGSGGAGSTSSSSVSSSSVSSSSVSSSSVSSSSLSSSSTGGSSSSSVSGSGAGMQFWEGNGYSGHGGYFPARPASGHGGAGGFGG